MTQTVLLAGATGMLGGRIAHHLLAQPDAKVRLLVRGGGSSKKQAALAPLLNAGAELIEGDLGDTVALDRATQGIDMIVSAVQGGPDVIIDGQLALAEAGKRNGVRRILPSDFGLDLFKATQGEHAAFNWRARADDVIAQLGMEHIHILQGGFMDLFGPGSPLLDYDKGVVQFWGDGTQPVEITSVEDTARMTARVALDRTVPSGKFAFAGDYVSFLEAAELAAAKTGRSFERRWLGSEADLRAAMAKAANTDPMQAIMLAYQLYMLNGQTALTHLQNNRYPDIQLTKFPDFLARRLAAQG
ncbi:NmrA-like family protein [Amantichitinum ursilacus]|uniref:NmrA-like family protein n=2 Tax=Amantichitinum ursilacus TaxID=857265 RepID=A0A0N0GN27_9NEIS|nr:NmrA-like family protein [Amantichitinum ursilacus]